LAQPVQRVLGGRLSAAFLLSPEPRPDSTPGRRRGTAMVKYLRPPRKLLTAE